MKRTFFILLLTISCLSSHSQWTNLGKVSTNVDMTSNGTGYKYGEELQGYGSPLHKTVDDWTNIEFMGFHGGGSHAHGIQALYFVNDQAGFLFWSDTGTDKIERTTNGGESFHHFATDMSPFIPTDDYYFFSDSIGYSGGSNYGVSVFNKLTYNKAERLIITDTIGLYACRMYFINAADGYLTFRDSLNKSRILKVLDYGETLEVLPFSSSIRLTDIFFPSDTIGYIAGKGGFISKTINAGISWEELSSPTTEDIVSVGFTSDTSGIIAGKNGELYSTMDGGNSWQFENTSHSGDFYKIDITSDNLVYLVASDSTLYKSDLFLSVQERPRSLIELQLYPNPVSTVLYIKTDLIGLRYSIIDIAGRLIVESSYLIDNTINLSKLSTGVYIIRIEDKDNRRFAIKRIVKI